jgi:CRP-like cAMP-binding protein
LFLNSSGVARKPVEYSRSQKIYSQGDIAMSVMYVQKGGVKLSVVSAVGKEAIVAVLGPGDFLGEGCLTGLPFRTGTATAITPSTILVIEKNEMIRILHKEQSLTCFRGTSESRRTYSINSLTPLRNGWSGLCCCSHAVASKTSRKRFFRKYLRRHWRK